eukprot:scaffold4199_cov64-Phaeocystis_antarctica.AAC.2
MVRAQTSCHVVSTPFAVKYGTLRLCSLLDSGRLYIRRPLLTLYHLPCSPIAACPVPYHCLFACPHPVSCPLSRRSFTPVARAA